MSIDEICDYGGSKGLSSIDSENDRLTDCCCVMITAFCILFVQFLSPWTNDFVWANSDNFSTNISGAPTDGTKTVIIELFGFPEYRLLTVLSFLLTSILFILIIHMANNGSSPGISAKRGVFIGAIYVIMVVGVEALFIPNSSSYLGSLLIAIVQYSLLYILLRRLSAPILPDIDEKERWETYRRNLRYRERAILSIGIGIIVSLVIAILPTNSSVGSLITVIALAGPIVFVLIGITVVGNHKLRLSTQLQYSDD